MLTWTCDQCNKPIADGDGYITLDEKAVRERRHAVQEWEVRSTGDSRLRPTGALVTIGAADLLAYPEAVRWETLHSACDPNPNRCDYFFTVERLRTAADVLTTTAHLLAKSWLGDTNWDAVLHRVASQLR